jgi:hypothetical protein
MSCLISYSCFVICYLYIVDFLCVPLNHSVQGKSVVRLKKEVE